MKLNLANLIKEYSNWNGPGFPALPSPANKHHFYKQPRSKHTEYIPRSEKQFPYISPDDDIKSGIEAAEEGANSKKEELPEQSLKELFKFTQSANDNTSFLRPPTQGAGAMGAYGKSAENYGTYDVDRDENTDEEENEKKLSIYKDQQDSKLKRIGEASGPGMRSRHTDVGPMSTKQGWANGIPTEDEKDIISGMAAVDDYLDELEECLKEEYQDTAHSRLCMTKIAHGPLADTQFWDNVNKDNGYMMSSVEEFEKRNKRGKNEKKKKISKKSK